MNAKLQAIERAGVKIESITRIVNFQMKYKAVESKAEAVLLPGFQVMDMGYQSDGSYQVVLSGKVTTDDKDEKKLPIIIGQPYDKIDDIYIDDYPNKFLVTSYFGPQYAVPLEPGKHKYEFKRSGTMYKMLTPGQIIYMYESDTSWWEAAWKLIYYDDWGLVRIEMDKSK